ncbi:MAG: hypothetical protein EOO25_05695 [Comamonadaceae bacterium]|nr:MAG: hypothetical protein EOO25_05695 [Comamonadaceae bacterium]
MQLRVSPRNEFLLAEIGGLVSVAAWEGVLGELGRAAHEATPRRLVVDLTALVGWLGIPERQEVGVLMASHLAAFERVSLFIQAEKITGVVESQARSHGLEMRLFSSCDDAVRWALA